MKSINLFLGLLFSAIGMAQSVEPLHRALATFEKDPQFTHALIGFYVVDKTGKIVFDKNAEIGMAPASTLKIVTSATAFELLGKDYQFKTQVGIERKNDVVANNLYFIGGGDPTFGSARWSSTNKHSIFQKVKNILADKGISQITGRIVIDQNRFLYPPVPNGWIWEDMGNYYGAGSWGFNWLENKYEVHLSSEIEVGTQTRIISTAPPGLLKQINNEILSAAKGSGDNAYLFSGPYSEKIFANGTIPAGQKDFVIYGALPDPAKAFLDDITTELGSMLNKSNPSNGSAIKSAIPVIIGTIYSPPLDSINYWFLKESVNLFGEAMVNTMALEQGKKVSTSNGIEQVRNFWAKNGIEKSALRIIDGSGLSPANRLTPKSLVQILEFARKRKWFPSFYNALPEMNGIRMKSGYIGGVRSYAGYIKSKSGEEYIFAFIINNFDGAASTVREKMYKVLNLLK